ncbi:MAG TPA: hypothetical protein VFF73_15175 [Planctomycetota bacterium]|nr:hypothetical protein [Planctomycetota bacterium]
MLVLVLVLGADRAFAQGAGNVQVGKTRIGYLDELDPGWVAVSVPLDSGSAEAKVRLVASAIANGTPVWTSEKTVTLPPKAHRVETLYLKITEQPNLLLHLDVFVNNFSIHSSQKAVNWRSNMYRGQRREPPVPLHALLVRDGPREESLLSWLAPQQRGNAPMPVMLASEQIEPRELPDRPQGFDGIDVVLLSKTSARDLDEARRRSLLSWIRNGGRVILMPGGDPAWFRDELVKELLPPDAEVVESKVHLATLNRFAGQAFGSDWESPIYILKSLRHGARIGGETVAGRRVPYFTAYKLGAGDVVFCALDLESKPLATWQRGREELGRFLHAALEPVPERHGTADDERLAPWFEQALIEGELPSPLLLIPVVLLYVVCVGPLNQRLVRRSSTPVLSVVTIPLIALVFTVVCFVAGYIVRGSSTSTDRLAVIEAHPGEELGREWAGLRIRSASSTSYTIGSDPLLVAQERSRDQAAGGAARSGAAQKTIQDDGRFAFPDLPLTQWERAFFHAYGPCPLGGPVSVLVTNKDVTVKNGTRFDLGQGVVFLPGTDGWRVPPLAPGAQATVGATTFASIKPEQSEVVAWICEEENQKKIATRSLDKFLDHLRTEMTYFACVKNASPAFSVGGRVGPDRDLAVLIVQGDDNARDEEVYRYAYSVRNDRSRQDYEDALAMLQAIRPTSRYSREAQMLAGYIRSAQLIDDAETAFEAGDLDEARRIASSVLSRPDLDSQRVTEIRGRLESWVAAGHALEDAGKLIRTGNLARALQQLTDQRKFPPDLATGAISKDAAEKGTTISLVRSLPCDEAAQKAIDALESGPAEACICARHALRRQAEAPEAVALLKQKVAASAKTLLDAARKEPRTILGRQRALDRLDLIEQCLEEGDSTAQAALALKIELEREIMEGRQ